MSDEETKETEEAPRPMSAGVVILNIVGILAGLAIMVGALIAWKDHGLDGYLAFLVAFGGFLVVSKAATGDYLHLW